MSGMQSLNISGDLALGEWITIDRLIERAFPITIKKIYDNAARLRPSL